MRQVQQDPGKVLEFEVFEETPHAFAYRMWFANPGEASWTPFGEGQSAGAHTTGPLPEGSQAFVWLNVGGAPNSNYRIRIRVSQDGMTIPGGDSTCTGQTSASGGGVCTDHLELV